MLAVIGEAIIDLIVAPDGHVVARPGGGPYNTARTTGGLGLSPVSSAACPRTADP
jgi:sugar/nucleoside kinase (ribokinase family)